LSACVLVSPQYSGDPCVAFGSAGAGVVPLWKMIVVPAGTSTARAIGNFEPPSSGWRTMSAPCAPAPNSNVAATAASRDRLRLSIVRFLLKKVRDEVRLGRAGDGRQETEAQSGAIVPRDTFKRCASELRRFTGGLEIVPHLYEY